jgi:hypothetical protein
MAKGRLFTFAVLHHPKVVKDAAGNEIQELSTILIQPTSIIAQDDSSARILAARAIPAEFMDKLEQVEIIVRPL